MRCRYCMNVMFLLSETHCFKVKSFSLPSPHFLPLPSPLPTLYLFLSHVMYVHYTLSLSSPLPPCQLFIYLSLTSCMCIIHMYSGMSCMCIIHTYSGIQGGLAICATAFFPWKIHKAWKFGENLSLEEFWTVTLHWAMSAPHPSLNLPWATEQVWKKSWLTLRSSDQSRSVTQG